jgi:hypothetical protein
MSRKKRASRKRARSWRKPIRSEIDDSAFDEASVTEGHSEPQEDPEEDDAIEVKFDEVAGRLEVSCEQGSFGLVRDLIVGLCDVRHIERDDVRIIEIRNDAAIAEHKERPPRWFSYGCLATVLGVAVSAVVGVVTIIRWIAHR